MKRKFLIIIISILSTGYGEAQITIEQCYRWAKDNYPMIRQHDLIDKTEQFNLSNANKSYLPQLSLSAKASYQSTVTRIPIEVPGMNIPTIAKDQYGIDLHLSQTIWDGGATTSNKDKARATAEASRQELEANLYQIQDRVNNLFFSILLLEAQLERNNIYQKELERDQDRIRICMNEGIANQTDLDIIQVELLNAKQNKTQLVANRRAFVEMLSHFTGQQIDTDSKFIRPNVPSNNTLAKNINRPELAMYDAKQRELESQRKDITASITPKFELFAQGGYGRPGLNMLENKFKGYYIGGVRMVWNFSSLYTKSNSSKLISVGQENLNVQRETFLFNTTMQMGQEENTIWMNRELLKNDDEIVRLRRNIKEASEKKLMNGTTSTTDYMHDVAAFDMARQQRIEHEIELLMSIYKHKFITNN